ncbi:MAG: GNAT family N-acetyltransferase [Alphaproteobacteria bacterium]
MPDMPDTARLTTERLILRPITLQDADQYEAHFATWNVIRHLNETVPWPYPKGGAIEHLIKLLPEQGKSEFFWALAERSDPDETLIGAIQLHKTSETEASRGFWLGQDWQGKGYMTEAVLAVQDYAFTTLGLDKLTITNAVDNRASSRIKQKTGARLLRTEPGTYCDPTLTMREVWELTSQDWGDFKSRNGLTF